MTTAEREPAGPAWQPFPLPEERRPPGSRTKASSIPSGLTAGTAPGVIIAGRPPATGTDSISAAQPCRAAKYAVRPSGETETVPPSTPPATRIRLATPVSGLSTTSAPRVVTATISGRPYPAVPDGQAEGGRAATGTTSGRSKLA